MERKTINIFDGVGGKAAVSTEDGDGLFETISAFKEKDNVEDSIHEALDDE